MVQFLDLFDKPVLNKFQEPVLTKKCELLFFERIVGILPMFVKQMNNN